MKILILGLGSMGRRYVDILQNYDHELFAYRLGLSPTPGGVRGVSWGEVKPDIAFITNPTEYHILTAIRCAEAGINLFIEKPIGISVKNLGKLIGIVKEKNLAAYVAYPFRFHDGLVSLRNKLTEPKNVQIVCRTDYKKWQPYGTQTHKRKHNGVLLELSHEVDIAQWFFGSIVGIKGFFGDTIADLKLKCIDAHNDILVKLDMESDVEERYIMVDGQIFPYSANDGMYALQVDYYLNNFTKPSELINNLEAASDMFCRLIQFRDGGKWGTL